MTRPFRWLVDRVGSATLLTLLLFLVALVSVTAGLSTMVRGLDFELLATIVSVAAVTGWLLARSPVRGRAALPVAIAAAVVTVFVRVGQLGDELFNLLVSLGRATGQLHLGRFDASQIAEGARPLVEGISTLVTRLVNWGRGMSAGQPGADLTASALVWSFLLWLATAWAAWMLRRKSNPFFALLPLMLFVTLLLAYSGHDVLMLVPFIGAFLALMVVVPHWTRQKQWQQQDVPSAQDLGLDLAIITVPAILIIVTAVVLIPAFSPAELVTAVRRWFQPDSERYTTFSDSIGLVPAPRPTTVFDTYTSPGMPRSHLIGAAPELLQELAFVVRTEDASSTPVPYHWLNATYDIYTGRGWYSSNLQTDHYRANEVVPQADAPPSRTLYQDVRRAQANGLVYAAGALVSVDHDFQVAWRANRDLFSVQVRADTYRVESRVRAFSADDLRAASGVYPAWVEGQYLALPQDLPPRVLALARDLTATAPTPYDRALAIENYLHTLPYTLDLPAPPPDRDVVDYFLFDLRRGYCDYYASAMAVLARAAGLPSRIAVGYASGTYDPSTGQYTVIEADAHSWTQVYFPGYGWVDFEPTTGRAELTEAEVSNLPQMPPLRGGPESNSSSFIIGNAIENPWYVGLSAVLLLVVGALAFVLMDSVRLTRLPPGRTAAALYRRLWRAARQFDPDVRPSHTPAQVALVLERYFESAARPKRLRAGSRSAAKQMQEIIDSYIQITYGGHAATAGESAVMIQKWLSLRGPLWLALVLHFVAQQSQGLRAQFREQSFTRTGGLWKR